MLLILILFLLLWGFGSYQGYSRWSYSGGIGIGGVLLLIFLVLLLTGYLGPLRL